MDIDGPEFLSEVNNQIAAIRSTASTGNLGGSALCVVSTTSAYRAHGIKASNQTHAPSESSNDDLSAYYHYYRHGMQGSPGKWC